MKSRLESTNCCLQSEETFSRQTNSANRSTVNARGPRGIILHDTLYGLEKKYHMTCASVSESNQVRHSITTLPTQEKAVESFIWLHFANKPE